MTPRQAIVLHLLGLAVAGCTVIVSFRDTPQQIEAAKVVQPTCIVGCSSQATSTQQQGARVDGATGAVSITKPLTATVTDDHSTETVKAEK